MYTIERIHMSGQIRLFSPYQRQNKEHFNEDKIWFEQRLVDFTNVNGSFLITYQNNCNKWGLTYKLTQSIYILGKLYYVKKQSGVGFITKNNTKEQLFIQKRKIMKTVLLAIFDKYPLLPTKHFDFLRF